LKDKKLQSDNEIKKQSGELSRRDFLFGAGAVAATTALCQVLPGETETVSAKETYDSDYNWAETVKNVKIEKLLEPGYIGKVKTRNRMIKTGAYGWILYDAATDTFRPEGLAYYGAIAKGGIGLMIMEDPAFRPDTIGRPLYEDKHIEREKILVDHIHQYDCPTFAQLTDFRPLMGIAASSEFYYASELDMNNSKPAALTLEGIQENVNMIAEGALRCKKSGYDGVELNCACSHMFATFLSRFWNKRTDDYGPQTFENRARIVVEMIQEIKSRCGSDYPVSILMNGFEINLFQPGKDENCTTVEEAIEFAKIFERAGADSIQVRSHSIGNHINGFFPEKYYMFGEKADTGYGRSIDLERFIPPLFTKYQGECGFVEVASTIKKAVDIPVMTVGCMDVRLHPEIAENAIRDGKLDFVCMTRPLTADPELPKKIMEGKIEDVRPCTYCISCFTMSTCRVNAASHRAGGNYMPEGYDIPKAGTKKKVMVIGGGPSGLEAARVAALRGHEVFLYEKSSRLGGLMPLAAMVKGTHEKIMDFVNWLIGQMDTLGVVVKTGKNVDLSVVEKVDPDVVIVATGGADITPNIPGINNPMVVKSSSLHGMLETGLRFVTPSTLRYLTNFYLPLGHRVVIIGGQIQGLQLAEFLSQRGREVTIVDSESEANLGRNLPSYVKPRLVNYVKAQGVKVEMGVQYNRITDEGIEVTTSYGITKIIEADSIVIAVPSATNTAFADSLQGKVPEVYTVGDCNANGVIIDAVASGNLTARKV
jgi:2,4-dienoyl-CoA reductase (NADPH2)